MRMLLVTQLIVSQQPVKLSPADAVRVLRSSHSDRDLTDYRVPPQNEVRIPVIVERKAAQPPATPTFVPLTCCGRYEIRLPYPTIIVRKER